MREQLDSNGVHGKKERSPPSLNQNGLMKGEKSSCKVMINIFADLTWWETVEAQESYSGATTLIRLSFLVTRTCLSAVTWRATSVMAGESKSTVQWRLKLPTTSMANPVATYTLSRWAQMAH
jgi:hypothetical protein